MTTEINEHRVWVWLIDVPSSNDLTVSVHWVVSPAKLLIMISRKYYNCLDKCLDEARDQDSNIRDRDQDQDTNPQDQDQDQDSKNTVSRLPRDETVSRDFPSLAEGLKPT